MDFNTVVKKRQSVRKYSLKNPDWRKIIRAIDIARYAPIAGNQVFLKYIIVNKEELIKKISQATQQSFVAKAPYLVIIVSNPKKLEKSYGEKAKRYASQGAGAAIENFLLSLTNQGLSSCWVGYYYEEQIKELLEIPDEMIIEGVFPIGIEAKNSQKGEKRKADLDSVLYFNSYGKEEAIDSRRIRSDWC
jgi:nitroreductase